MPTVAECGCCQEKAAVRQKMEEEDIEVECITLHPGFQEVCLSVYSLQTAYYSYRQDYGAAELRGEEVHRYKSYRTNI